MFLPVAARDVTFLRGRWWVGGTLDGHGDFTETAREQVVRGLSSFPFRGGVINGHPAWGKVYEFRSNVLVPGMFDENRRFIPEVGGKIIRFREYVYGPKAPLIYNLPGYFALIRPVAPPG